MLCRLCQVHNSESNQAYRELGLWIERRGRDRFFVRRRVSAEEEQRRRETWGKALTEAERRSVEQIVELSRTRKAADEAAIKLVLGDPSEIAQRDERCFTRWMGRQEALIDRGICTAEQFPAGRKRAAYGEGDPGGKVDSWLMTRLRGGICEYVEHYSQARLQRKDVIEDPALKSPDAFAESVEVGARGLLRLLKGQCPASLSGPCTAEPRSFTTVKPSSVWCQPLHRSSNTCKPALSHGRGTWRPSEDALRPSENTLKHRERTQHSSSS